MPELSRLGKHKIIGFVTITDAARAKAFYADKLGLKLLYEEPPFAIVFEANGIMLRLTLSKEPSPAQGTVLGWEAPRITETVNELEQAGVRFERFEPLDQDEHGIWTAPSGDKVAWFKDPDGNILSVSEHVRRD